MSVRDHSNLSESAHPDFEAKLRVGSVWQCPSDVGRSRSKLSTELLPVVLQSLLGPRLTNESLWKQQLLNFDTGDDE